MITIKDIYKIKRPMELKDKMCENDPIYMVYDFDPRETSFETWLGFYEDFRMFLPELTKKRFKDILREHRLLYNQRADIKWWQGLKHPMRAIFDDDYFKDRLFPLSPVRYGEWEMRICGKKKKVFQVMRNEQVTASGKGGTLKEKTFIQFIKK